MIDNTLTHRVGVVLAAALAGGKAENQKQRGDKTHYLIILRAGRPLCSHWDNPSTAAGPENRSAILKPGAYGRSGPRTYMANIPIGTSNEEKLLVTSEVAINFLGTEGARVLSTPHMIGYMERTCRNTVLPLLDPGYERWERT